MMLYKLGKFKKLFMQCDKSPNKRRNNNDTNKS